MKCPECGTELYDGLKFCEACGCRLSAAPALVVENAGSDIGSETLPPEPSPDDKPPTPVSEESFVPTPDPRNDPDRFPEPVADAGSKQTPAAPTAPAEPVTPAAPMAPVAPTAPAEPMAPTAPTAPAEPVPPVGFGFSESPKTPSPKSSSASEPVSSVVPPAVPVAGMDDCPVDVRIKQIFFICGANSIIQLQFIPKSSELTDILFFWKNEQKYEEFQVTSALSSGHPVSAYISFTPNVSGQTLFRFYVGCKVKKSFNWYEFSSFFPVYPVEVSKEHIALTINQTIESDTGITEAPISVNDIRTAQNAPDIYSMVEKLNAVREFSTVAPLQVSTWRPFNFIEGNKYLSDRIVLECNGLKMYCFGRKEVSFGRNPKIVDLVVRKSDCSPNERPNITVSGHHCDFVYNCDSVTLQDCSSYGTELDKRRLQKEKLKLPGEADIKFGDIGFSMSEQRCSGKSDHLICRSCGACERDVKATTFFRNDGEKSCYLLVWRCCELGMIMRELSNWAVFYRNGLGFIIRTPEQKFYYLRPGTKISCDEMVVTACFP